MRIGPQCLLAVALSAIHVMAQVEFSAPMYFPVGPSPGPLVLGDFNCDGKPDVACLTSQGCIVLLNVGGGALSVPTNVFGMYLAGGAIATGDFNKDSILDLVVAQESSSTYAVVLLGDGSGRFTPITNSAVLNYPSCFAVGDFNQDGNLDLAVGNNPMWVSILFGRGDGSFGPRTNYTLKASVCDVRSDNVFGNQRPDLVVSFSWYSSFCVLSNAGAGAFTAPKYYGPIIYNSALELGDFNKDAGPDVAVVGRDAQLVSIWTNDGRGGFFYAYRYYLGFSPSSVAKADFNMDGRLDLVICGGTTMQFLLGTANASFVLLPPVAFPSNSFSLKGSIAAGDMDGDDLPDLVFANPASNSVGIMLNRSPPWLQITPMGGYNQISWHAGAGAGFVLEYSTNVSEPDGWMPFPYPPVTIGNQRAIADWASGAQKFYRLRKP